MKILVLTHTFPRFKGDTAAPFMGELAEAMVKGGQDVTVLAPYDPQFNLGEKRPYKIKLYKYILPERYHRLGYSNTLVGDKQLKFETYLIAPFMYLFGFVALARELSSNKYDVLNTHWLVPSGFLAAIATKIFDIPYTVTIPGSDVYMGHKNPVFKWLVGVGGESADWVISDSKHYMNDFKSLGFKPKDESIIRYGVTTAKFKPTEKNKVLLKHLNIKSSDPIILCVGRLVAKKGFKYLVQAMPDVVKNYKNAKLVIVGDGDQRKELENLVSKLNIKDNVFFAGMISYSELSKYYNLADVFAMPSIRDEKGNIDASPVAMMEAMSCGARVVATDFSGSSEIIIEGETGFVVKDKDEKAIAISINKLLQKGTNKRVKNKVHKIAVDNFSTKVVARKYSEIFERITSKTLK